jgi:hypothetical protein
MFQYFPLYRHPPPFRKQFGRNGKIKNLIYQRPKVSCSLALFETCFNCRRAKFGAPFANFNFLTTREVLGKIFTSRRSNFLFLKSPPFLPDIGAKQQWIGWRRDVECKVSGKDINLILQISVIRTCIMIIMGQIEIELCLFV